MNIIETGALCNGESEVDLPSFTGLMRVGLPDLQGDRGSTTGNNHASVSYAHMRRFGRSATLYIWDCGQKSCSMQQKHRTK